MSKRCKCGILVGSFMLHQFPAYRSTHTIVDSEEVEGDQMLDGGEEDLEIMVGDDPSIKQLGLGKNVAEALVGLTPGVQRLGRPISDTGSRRAWRRRGSGSGLWGRHAVGWLGGLDATDEDRGI